MKAWAAYSGVISSRHGLLLYKICIDSRQLFPGKLKPELEKDSKRGVVGCITFGLP